MKIDGKRIRKRSLSSEPIRPRKDAALLESEESNWKSEVVHVQAARTWKSSAISPLLSCHHSQACNSAQWRMHEVWWQGRSVQLTLSEVLPVSPWVPRLSSVTPSVFDSGALAYACWTTLWFLEHRPNDETGHRPTSKNTVNLQMDLSYVPWQNQYLHKDAEWTLTYTQDRIWCPVYGKYSFYHQMRQNIRGVQCDSNPRWPW